VNFERTRTEETFFTVNTEWTVLRSLPLPDWQRTDHVRYPIFIDGVDGTGTISVAFSHWFFWLADRRYRNFMKDYEKCKSE